MRLSDLLSAVVFDRSGHKIGKVHDVLLIQDGPMVGDEASLRVEGLVVGRGAIATRLGYDRSEMHGPWVLKMLFEWLHRHSRFVAWDDVAAVTSERIVVDKHVEELGEPPLA